MANGRATGRAGWGTLGTVLLTIGWACGVHAQAPPFLMEPEFAPPTQRESHLRRLPQDPLALMARAKAVQAIEAGTVADGLQSLQTLLDDGADFFVQNASGGSDSFLSLVEQRILAHQADYERLYGGEARKLLQDSQAEQNTAQLAEVVRRFSLTQAGVEALQELSRVLRDQGEYAAAARSLEQLASHPLEKNSKVPLERAAKLLVAAGQTASARSLLERRSDLFTSEEIALLVPQAGAHETSSSHDGISLYQWRTPYGGISQTGQAAFAPMVGEKGWHAPLIHEYDFDSLLVSPELAEELADETQELGERIDNLIRADENRIALPAARPLIVNDLVICAGPGSLKAYDLKTGDLRWSGVVIDQTFDFLSKQSYSPSTSDDPARREMRELFAAVRGWRDLTSSSLSTDGRQVYAISDCQIMGAANPQQTVQAGLRHALLPQRSNRLHAFDLASDGKLRWSIGAPKADRNLFNEVEEENREVFFFGPPLPMDGRLYVLGEEGGQIQLFEIDPATGAIDWSIGLLNPYRDLLITEARRLSGLMPTYADGLLICPTGEGVLTAVDPVQRRVVWSQSYANVNLGMRERLMFFRSVRSQSVAYAMQELMSDQRWFDNRIMAGDGYVVFTPPDEASLICLRAQDGMPVWSTRFDRRQWLYAGGLFEGSVILVGRGEVSAISLETGAPVWKDSMPIPHPAGRGLVSGHCFLQPLRTGEVAVIDLRTGRLLARSPLPEDALPGNLAATDGAMVMQSANRIFGFQSRQALQGEIAAAEQDPAGQARMLALRGEMALQQGALASGLDDLNEAFKIEAPPRAQWLLSWTLLDGLRTDFPAFRSRSQGIEQLLQNREQRLLFLQVYAQGLDNAGEYSEAFARSLEVLDILPAEQGGRDLDGRGTTTDFRWILGRLQHLVDVADEPTRQEIFQLFSNWIAEQQDAGLLLTTLTSVPIDWIDPPAALERLSRLPIGSDGLFQRETLLARLSQSEDMASRAEANRQLLDLAILRNDAETLGRLLTALEAMPAEFRFADDVRASDFVTEFRSRPQVARLVGAVTVWPHEAVSLLQTESRVRSSIFQIPVLGAPSPELAGYSFFIDANGSKIDVFDQNGFLRAQIPTGLSATRYASGSTFGRYVDTQGRLALIVLLDRFLILDFFSNPSAPQVIVNQSLIHEEENPYGSRMFLAPDQRIHPGLRSVLVNTSAGGMAGNVGPLTESMLCYGFGETLVAIDPSTGRELWRQSGVPQGSEILGDEQFVVVKPPDSGMLEVFAGSDGRAIGSVPLPTDAIRAVARRGGDWGRLLPVIAGEAGDTRWEMFDPAVGKVLWSQPLPMDALWAPVQGENIAFLSGEHELVIRQARTGEELFRQKLPIDHQVEQFSVLQFPEQWIVLTDSGRSRSLTAGHFGYSTQDLLQSRVDGAVVAIDRTSNTVAWCESVANQRALLQSPGQWPVLILASSWGSNIDSMLMNRWTGEIVHQKTRQDDQTGLAWRGESDPLRIHIKFARDEVILNFTDVEVPPVEDSEPMPAAPGAPAQREEIEGPLKAQ